MPLNRLLRLGDLMALWLALVGLLTIFGATLSQFHWIFDFLGLFLLFGFWFLCISGVYTLLRRHWLRACVIWLTVCLVAVIILDVSRLHKHAVDTSNLTTVYQHNIFARNTQKDEITNGIILHATDFVVLLEAVPWRDNDYLNPALQAYDYSVKDPFFRGRTTRIQFHANAPLKKNFMRRTRSGAAIVVAKTQMAGVDLTLAGVHFARPWPFDSPDRQMQQAREVIAMLDDIEGNLLVLGDLNSTPWGRVAKALEAGLELRVKRTGLEATWPSRLGVGNPDNLDASNQSIGIPKWLGIPIDLVLTRGDIAIHDWRTTHSRGSDHRGIVFEIGKKHQDQ